MEKRYQVFVSSTYADLKDERQSVIQTLMEMDCIPAGMELFPAADEEQWNFIKRVIEDCDYYILIIGARYGSVSESGISYTQMEYQYALDSGLKVLAFVHNAPDDLPASKSDRDAELRKKLGEFRELVKQNRLVKFWKEPNELSGLVALSLAKTIKMHPAVGWIRGDNALKNETLLELNELRKENAQLKAKISELTVNEPPIELNIAGLDETFTVRYSWRDANYYNDSSFREEANWSWSEIFAAIAPGLAEYPTNVDVNKLLAYAIYRKEHVNRESPVTASVYSEDFDTIRIQLETHGLIATDYANTTQGKMSLFWKITPKGKKLMLQIRTVPSSK